MRFMPKTANDKFICFCHSQKRILTDELGVPETSVIYVTNPVDYDFFSPSAQAEPNAIFAAGREMRDYQTLVAAADGLNIPITISASGFMADSDGPRDIPANVSVLSERVSHEKIKALYASARLVVVPLHPANYAAGVNGVLEAMAMGKPVVATRSAGIADYVKDGETGKVVEPADPLALRLAIEELWREPDRCAEIGRRNRLWVQANASISDYCVRLASLADAVSAPASAPMAGAPLSA
jgi:glycosyltransferase involved in cell wall biosynthesis